MERQYDLVIIGSGPAGMSASIYASRAGLKTAMLDLGAPGGKLNKTSEIANWPGILSGSGMDLANAMFEHATAFGSEYIYGNVVKVVDGETHKTVICEDGETYRAQAVIVASGTKERTLNIPGEEANVGRGVSYCAVCDGAFFKNREVAVIGGGNAALEEAEYLTQFADKVYIVIRRDVFRADQIVQDRIITNSKIDIIRCHVPRRIDDDGTRVTGIVIADVNTQTETTLNVQGIFPYIGQDPATDFLADLDVLDEHGYIKVDANCETTCHGIYGAGDVIVKPLRQVVTAVNDGAIAAQHAFHQVRGI